MPPEFSDVVGALPETELYYSAHAFHPKSKVGKGLHCLDLECVFEFYRLPGAVNYASGHCATRFERVVASLRRCK